MKNLTYREMMVETMLVETLNNNVTRFDHLLRGGMCLGEIVTMARAMRLLVDKALEQSIQKVIDSQEPVPPTVAQQPDYDFPFDPNMN